MPTQTDILTHLQGFERFYDGQLAVVLWNGRDELVWGNRGIQEFSDDNASAATILWDEPIPFLDETEARQWFAAQTRP